VLLARLRRSQVGLAAILAVVVAYVVMAQGAGWNQNAHYSLVRALSNGTPTIDKTRYETGEWYSTGDITSYRGHYYAAKAPGLAFASLPAYLPLKGAGVWNSGDDTKMLWWLALWAVVLPAGILFLLVRHVADRLQPGTGTLVAVTLGLATLVLPFSTLYFAHLLSATLGFAAFAVLWHEREGPPRIDLVAGAGLLAGLAITTEYPLGIIGVILAVYAALRGPFASRILTYAAGGLAGVLPLLLYQWWAFGSPTHFAYENVYGGLNVKGTFGIGAPSFRVAMELLFSRIGLFTLSPVLALAAIGIVLLYRRGRRAEALLVAVTSLAYLVYNSGYETPFGGRSPGPRFLIAILPFLALGLGPIFARRPLTALSLAVPSGVLMVAVTVTHPILAVDGHWFRRFGDQDLSATVLSFFRPFSLDSEKLPSSGHWYALLVFFVPVVLAVAFALAGQPRLRLSLQDALAGATCLAGWLALYHETPKLIEGTGVVSRHWGPAFSLLLAASVALIAVVLPYLLQDVPSPIRDGDSSRA
jgi:hypothetical protein